MYSSVAKNAVSGILSDCLNVKKQRSNDLCFFFFP